jgi:hypothetical protein
MDAMRRTLDADVHTLEAQLPCRFCPGTGQRQLVEHEFRPGPIIVVVILPAHRCSECNKVCIPQLVLFAAEGLVTEELRVAGWNDKADQMEGHRMHHLARVRQESAMEDGRCVVE